MAGGPDRTKSIEEYRQQRQLPAKSKPIKDQEVVYGVRNRGVLRRDVSDISTDCAFPILVARKCGIACFGMHITAREMQGMPDKKGEVAKKTCGSRDTMAL